MTNDDYLWDGSGSDAETERLEEALGRFVHRERELGELPPREPRPRLRPLPLLVAAAAAAALTLLATRLLTGDDPAAPYRLESLTGIARVSAPGATELRADGALAFGESVATGAGDRALIHVGDIGSVELRPESEVAVKRAGDLPGTGDAGYLLALERGAVSATIFAAPRLFQLGTPGGIAVDLGCIYEAEIEGDDGTTLLRVTQGRVSFETEGRQVLVPAGAHTRSFPGRGPATPAWDDSAPELLAALALVDADPRDGEALAEVLRLAGERDSLSLWHLRDLPDGGGEQVVRRLLELAPVPAGVAEEDVLSGDREARQRWLGSFEWL